MKNRCSVGATCVLIFFLSVNSLRGDGHKDITPGKLIVEPPTLRCLSFQWPFKGDTNQNAVVTVRYRKAGDKDWKRFLPLHRTHRSGTGESGADRRVDLFAGSILDLEPGTKYEVRLSMADPDGVSGPSVRTRTRRTRTEPEPFDGGEIRHVYPSEYEGTKKPPSYDSLLHAYYGTDWEADSFGISSNHVQPGDSIVLHEGTYTVRPRKYHADHGTTFQGTYFFTLDGTEEKPITIRAAKGESVVINGNGVERLFDVSGADHHIFEGITFRNAKLVFVAGTYNVTGCDGLVVKRCTMKHIGAGIFAPYHGSRNFYVADNRFIGKAPLDRFQAWGPVQSYYAVKVNGSGHVICYNYAAGFYDGFDVFTEDNLFLGKRTAIDVYNNDVHRMNDNFLEADGATHNVRFFRNRGLNAGSVGISNQPVEGGPVYWVRNIIYNASPDGAIKNLRQPRGVLVYHNTISGNLTSWSTPPYGYMDYRNNIFLCHSPDVPGADPRSVIAWQSTDPRSVLNYNGYRLPKLNGAFENAFVFFDPTTDSVSRYRSFSEFRRKSGLENHGVVLGSHPFRDVPGIDYGDRRLFTPEDLDFRLRPNAKAVDAGVSLPGINSEYTGDAPDLGARERDRPAPHYGPRKE